MTFSAATLAGGTITDGTLSAASYDLQDGEIDANLAGGAVTVAAGGYVVLTGTNTYTGGTTIENTGTLAVGPHGVGAGTVTIDAGGTLLALDDMSLSTTQNIISVANTSQPDLAAAIDTGGYSVTLAGTIGGSADLAKAGEGTLNVSGVNNSGFIHNLVVQGGLVAASGMSNLGSSGSTLVFDGGGLQWTAAFDIPASKVIDIRAGGATFDSNGHNVTIAATLGQWDDVKNWAGGVTVTDSSGGGRLTLAPVSANLYLGGTTIDGVVAAAADAVFGDSSGPITFGSAGLLKAIGDLTTARAISTPDDPAANATIDSNGHAVTFNGTVSGNGGLTATNTSTASNGSLTLSAANTFTGVATIVSQVRTETLVLANPDALQYSIFDTSGSGTLSFGSLAYATFGGLQGSGSLAIPPGVTLTVGGNDYTTTLSGSLTGGGSLIVAGAGGLVLTGDNSGFTGVTTVTAGTLEAATPAALPGDIFVSSGATMAVCVDGTDAWTQSQIAALLTSGVFQSGANLGIDTGYTSFTYGNVISDYGANVLGLVVLGNGTLVLTGNNTYSGGTTIEPTATLEAATSAALPANFAVASGGTLAFDVDGTGAWNASQIAAMLTADRFASGANVGIDTGSTTFSYDSLSDIGSNVLGLVVLGNGTLALTGTNMFSGSVLVSAGATLHIIGPAFDYLCYTMANAISGAGTLRVENFYSITLCGDQSNFTGTYDLEGGYGIEGEYQFENVVFATPATSGQANLVVNGGATVSFAGSGSPTFNFGNLSGDANATVDLTDPNSGENYTVNFHETGATEFDGQLLDASASSGTVVIVSGGGSLTFGDCGVSVNGQLVVDQNTGVAFPYECVGANSFCFRGNIVNAGMVFISGDSSIDGTFTNNGYFNVVAGTLTINGTFINNNDFEFYSGAVVVNGTFVNNESTFISGATLTINGTFANNSGMTLYPPSFDSPTPPNTSFVVVSESGTFINAEGSAIATYDLAPPYGIEVEGVLRFDINSWMDFSVPISGSSGTIVMDGSGVVTLDGDTSNFAGTIEVLSGTLYRES